MHPCLDTACRWAMDSMAKVIMEKVGEHLEKMAKHLEHAHGIALVCRI